VELPDHVDGPAELPDEPIIIPAEAYNDPAFWERFAERFTKEVGIELADDDEDGEDDEGGAATRQRRTLGEVAGTLKRAITAAVVARSTARVRPAVRFRAPRRRNVRSGPRRARAPGSSADDDPPDSPESDPDLVAALCVEARL